VQEVYYSKEVEESGFHKEPDMPDKAEIRLKKRNFADGVSTSLWFESYLRSFCLRKVRLPIKLFLCTVYVWQKVNLKIGD
jgi:hypothetical protein